MNIKCLQSMIEIFSLIEMLEIVLCDESSFLRLILL